MGERLVDAQDRAERNYLSLDELRAKLQARFQNVERRVSTEEERLAYLASRPTPAVTSVKFELGEEEKREREEYIKRHNLPF